MFSEIISNMPNIAILPIITTVVFFLVFIGITIWALRVNKSYIKRMSELPLDSSMKSGE
jgi:hypothetical protein